MGEDVACGVCGASMVTMGREQRRDFERGCGPGLHIEGRVQWGMYCRECMTHVVKVPGGVHVVAGEVLLALVGGLPAGRYVHVDATRDGAQLWPL